MLHIFKLFLVFIIFLTLSGCCSSGSCGPSNGPPPHPDPSVKNLGRENCEGPSCCYCKRCCSYAQPIKCCPRPCGRNGFLQQLACQGVQVVELGNRVDIILFTDNCFATGTADINETCQPILNNIACLLCSYGDICNTIHITGYTDNIGYICPKYPLSQHLADAVLGYLWSHGIPLEKLCAKGCACNDPIATTHTPCGNAFNRRVEITLWRYRI